MRLDIQRFAELALERPNGIAEESTIRAVLEKRRNDYYTFRKSVRRKSPDGKTSPFDDLLCSISEETRDGIKYYKLTLQSSLTQLERMNLVDPDTGEKVDIN